MAICRDKPCYYNETICCRDCPAVNSCQEVCDNMDPAELSEDCSWREEAEDEAN